MKLTKHTLFYHIYNFGTRNERELRERGDEHGASEINLARITLHLALLDGVEEVIERLKQMTEYETNEYGTCFYNIHYFVQDDYTRYLLNNLKKMIEEMTK